MIMVVIFLFISLWFGSGGCCIYGHLWSF